MHRMPDRQRIHGGSHIMHTYHARPTLDGDQCGGSRAGSALYRIGPAGQCADHRFARQPGIHTAAQVGEALQCAQQRHVVFQRLAETKTDVDHHLAPVDAGQFAGEKPVREEPVHLTDYVVVMRLCLHAARFALHVHQTYRYAEFGDGIHRALTAQGINVIDHTGTGSYRRTHHFRLGSVDRDRQRNARDQLLDDRQHPAQFFLDGDIGRTRTGGFTTDVEHVGALFRHAQAMRHRRFHAVVCTTVRERVGREIENADHARTIEPQRASGAIKNRRKQIDRHTHSSTDPAFHSGTADSGPG